MRSSSNILPRSVTGRGAQQGRSHDEGWIVSVQRALLDRHGWLIYSPLGTCRGKKGGHVGRRQGDQSLFEVIRSQEGSVETHRSAQAEDAREPRATGSEATSGNGDQSRSRKRVDLDDPAKRIPTATRLGAIPDVSSSMAGDGHPRGRSFWGDVVEIRRATLLVFGIAFLLMIAVAYMSGKSSAPVELPAGMAELDRLPVSERTTWPVLNPEPEVRPAIRNIVQSNIASSGFDSATSTADVVPAIPPEPIAVVQSSQSLYAVMIGQQLSKDPAVVDKLVQYVDSGLTSSKARVRISDSRNGRNFSVFVGPFKNLKAARSALREIQVLRPHQGVRFRDAFPIKMVFTPDELQKYQFGN